MAHLLRVTDGTTTVNLTGGPIYLREYVPQSPNISTVEFVSWSMYDGGDIFSVTRRNVTEPAQVTVIGSTNDEAREQVRALEALFLQAEEYQRSKKGNRVWVEFQPGQSGDIYRSEILYGKVEPGSETLHLHWPEAAIECAVIWRRRFFWEGPEEELPLTNGGGSGSGGRTIYNHDDGGTGHDNWVEIDGDDVGGVLPAPIRLEITNTYNFSTRSYDFFIGHNVFSSPGSLSHILEAEDADSKGTDYSDAIYSNGARNAFTWSGDTQSNLWRWDLSPSLLNACAGHHFRLIAKFSTAPSSSTKLQAALYFPSGVPLTKIAESAEVALSSTAQTQEIGALQIPPWLPGETDQASISLLLKGRREGGGTLYLDFLQLTPMDSYRVLSPKGYGAAYLVRVVDDGIEKTLWTDGWAGGGKTGHYIGYGRTVHLWPGRDQLLYFLVTNNSTSLDEIDRTHSVRVYYRPRRVTL